MQLFCKKNKVKIVKYTNVQEFGLGKIFNVFESRLYYIYNCKKNCGSIKIKC